MGPSVAVLRRWSVETIILAKLFDVPSICHGDGVAYVQWLYALFWKFCEKWVEEKGFYRLVLFCLEPPLDKLHIMRDAADWWL